MVYVHATFFLNILLCVFPYKILINDGLDACAIDILKKSGLIVNSQKYTHLQLLREISSYHAIVVRSATQVTADIIDAGHPNLKLIARAGVGLDNIDVNHAKQRNVVIINTPTSSTRSVAELVFTHIFTLARGLHISNRKMPSIFSNKEFVSLKRDCSGLIELKNKTLGIIGFGAIGQEVARIALALQMNLRVYDYKARRFHLDISIGGSDYRFPSVKIPIITTDCLDSVLQASDIVTVHTPGVEEIIGPRELALMKRGSILINCARGGVVNEAAIVQALSNPLDPIAFAGIDTFVDETTSVNRELLSLPQCSFSPHIGASTFDAQTRVSVDLAEGICKYFSRIDQTNLL